MVLARRIEGDLELRSPPFSWESPFPLKESWSGHITVSLSPGKRPACVEEDYDGVRFIVEIDWSQDDPRANSVMIKAGDKIFRPPASLVRFRFDLESAT